MTKNGMRPIHPGEILKEEYLEPLGMSGNALSKALHVPATRINDILLERRGVTPDTALRLARFFGGDAESWLNLQQAYDLKIASKQQAKSIVKDIVPLNQLAPTSRMAA
jgi:addiction module HigA family antidote